MSFESFLADPQATREWGDWLVILHPVSPLGVSTPLYFSHRGTIVGPAAVTVSPYTIAAHTPFRRRLAVAPTISHSLWARGRIGGESQPAYGSLQLVNQDGGLDQYRPTVGGWRWKNTPCQIFFCDSRTKNIADTVGCVSDGLVKEARIGLGGATIELQGFEARFGEMTSNRLFRGTSYQLELSGNKTVDYGAVTAVDLTGDMSLETWLWLNSSQTSANVTIWGWNGSTTFPWHLRTNTARKLILRCTIGGVAEAVTTTLALSFFTPYHVSIDIDGRDVTFRIWNDDTQTLTTEVFVNGFSSATRDAFSGGNYQVRSVDATYAIWVDEMRVFDVVRSESEHAGNRFGEFSDGALPSSLVHYARMNDGTGTTVVDEVAASNGTISGAGTHTWLWAMEGGSELANTPKPETWGYAWNVAPVLVDPVRNVYLVAPADTANVLDDIVVTREGGNPHTMDAEAASLRAFMTTTPAAGHSLPYSARGLFRLGSTPTLPISAEVSGFGASGGDALLTDIVEALITTRLSTTPTLDTASFTALATALNGASYGLFLRQPEPIRQTLDTLIGASAEAWWGYLRGTQNFHVEQFTGPADTADYDWDEHDIVNVEPLDAQTVIYGVEVKFAQNHVVLNAENEVAAVIKGTRDWAKFTEEWQFVRRNDDAIRRDYPGDASVLYTVETAIRDRAAAEAFADFLLELLKGPKEGFKVTLKPIGRVVRVGQTATISVVLQRGRSRLDLDGSKLYVVLDVTETQQKGETVVTCWGGEEVIK